MSFSEGLRVEANEDAPNIGTMHVLIKLLCLYTGCYCGGCDIHFCIVSRRIFIVDDIVVMIEK